MPSEIPKKIGILNFQYSNHNYGAVLQAAALEFSLKKLGYEALHIDFKPRRRITLRYLVGEILRLLRLKKKSAVAKINNKEAFERFRQGHIERTRRVETKEEFIAIASCFDTVIVGSDQVWRPSMSSNAAAFFLAYVPPSVNRVSYAASFGVGNWSFSMNSVFTIQAKEELKKFKAISCRESSGVDICENIFEVNAVQVLDPLLLVEDDFFKEIISDHKCERAPIIHYKLDASEGFNKSLSHIEQVCGAKSLNIYLQEGECAGFREVPDWLCLIYKSEIVITDSYHCICLALRFGKEIYYSPNPDRGQARLESLFNMFDLDLVHIAGTDDHPIYKLHRNKDIGAILIEKRRDDVLFLINALSS